MFKIKKEGANTDFLSTIGGWAKGEWLESWRIIFYPQLSEESSMAKRLFCIIYSLITMVFVTSWPAARLADVIAVEKKLTGRWLIYSFIITSIITGGRGSGFGGALLYCRSAEPLLLFQLLLKLQENKVCEICKHLPPSKWRLWIIQT